MAMEKSGVLDDALGDPASLEARLDASILGLV